MTKEKKTLLSKKNPIILSNSLNKTTKINPLIHSIRTPKTTPNLPLNHKKTTKITPSSAVIPINWKENGITKKNLKVIPSKCHEPSKVVPKLSKAESMTSNLQNPLKINL